MGLTSRTFSSFLEILFITALVLLFGLTTYTLVAVGGDSYGRILSKRDNNSDARVALSYMTTRIRQTDRTTAVSIDEVNGTQILTLSYPSEDETYENRVYCLDGMLYEALVPAEDPFDPASGEEIVALDAMQLDYVTDRNGAVTAIRLAVWPAAGRGDEKAGVPVETVLSLSPA